MLEYMTVEEIIATMKEDEWFDLWADFNIDKIAEEEEV